MDTVRIDLRWSYGHGRPKRLYGPGKQVEVPVGLARALGHDVEKLLAAEVIQTAVVDDAAAGDSIVTVQTLDNIITSKPAAPKRPHKKK